MPEENLITSQPIPKSKTQLYKTWHSMMYRCYNPKSSIWKYYGGKGIKVCGRWHTFENFAADVGERPSPKHSLDRFPNSSGDYSPDNTRWATAKEQNRNKENTVKIQTIDGILSLTEWAEIRQLEDYQVQRIRLGWDIDRAINRPKVVYERKAKEPVIKRNGPLYRFPNIQQSDIEIREPQINDIVAITYPPEVETGILAYNGRWIMRHRIWHQVDPSYAKGVIARDRWLKIIEDHMEAHPRQNHFLERLLWMS